VIAARRPASGGGLARDRWGSPRGRPSASRLRGDVRYDGILVPTTPPPRACPSNAGLCAECVHLRLVGSPSRTIFVQCGRARNEATFVRYPRLPVVSCTGFERGPA